MRDEVKEYLRQIASKGGKARAKALSKEKRQAIGKSGAKARWGRRKSR